MIRPWSATPALLLCACTAAKPPEPPQAPDLGWASAVVLDPALFEGLMGSSPREGWIALHAHDHLGALQAFAGDPGANSQIGASRAHMAESALQLDLQRVTSLAVDTLLRDWSARGTEPAGGDRIRDLVARCNVDGLGPSLPDPGAAGEPTLQARLAMHRAAVDSQDPSALHAPLPPLMVVQDGDVQRTWYDPCVHRTLADVHGAAANLSAPAWSTWTDPAASLFAPWPDVATFQAALERGEGPLDQGATSPLSRRLGLPEGVATTDDAEAARAEVRALDERLDQARKDLSILADDEGAALLDQIGVVDRLRQELLVVRARLELRAGHPRRALAMLSLARDVTDRSIGPRNSPALMAMLAEANLRTGRAREALDALQALSHDRPEVLGLRELVGDLAVLQSLDRVGDSKEH